MTAGVPDLTPTAAPIAIPVRDAGDDDIPAIQDIYAHYVLNSLASFEEQVPEVDEIARRRAAVLERGMPYLVAECDGRVRGFAYCAPYRDRSAYRYMVEDSIYVSPETPRRGLGRALLSTLITRAGALGYRQMVAVIGDSQNRGSIGLHQNLGFREVGVLRSAGWKFGGWVDSVLMQRALPQGDGPFPDESTDD